MKVLRWIGILLGTAAAVAVAIGVAARFHDGPIGPFPGGPMDGEVVTDPGVNWSFAANVPTIELQTSNPPRSRTVWFIVHAGAAYVPCGFVAAKRWPHTLAEDPVVLLRIGGKLYVRTAVRVTDEALLGVLWGEVERKYGPAMEGDYESNWIFRMDPFEPNA
jgi:hypothetical protein